MSQPLMNAHKPLAVSSIKISEFSAGDVAPVITGIKFLDTSDAREILLELGLTWSGNPSLMFHITSALAAFQTLDIKVHPDRNAKPPLHFLTSPRLAKCMLVLSEPRTGSAQVDHFTIFCPLRIAIKPLLPVSPVLGNITLSFIGKPNIDFSLAVAGGTLDMMAIPGLSSFLQHFLRETITSRMVYPNIVTVGPLYPLTLRLR
jgi:Ca2+-dependent lipid-binding protein